MEDDVIAGLGNIRLTTDEEEIIAIFETGRLEAIESCCLSLMCKPFNKRAAKTTIRRAWGMEEGYKSLRLVQICFNLNSNRNLI